MAQWGGGEFRDFENHEPVNFLSFKIGDVRRNYILKDFYVTNFSAPPDSPVDGVDSDSDGLSDADEAIWGTDPRNPDTDGDGYSDGMEVRLVKLGVPLHPTVFDPGCAPYLIHVDSDCDGIWDCDEQLLGSNANLVDTDKDGAPDGIEYRLGTQLTAQDLGFDPDSDGILNGVELRLHSNPAVPDADTLSQFGYRYEITADSSLNAEGSSATPSPWEMCCSPTPSIRATGLGSTTSTWPIQWCRKTTPMRRPWCDNCATNRPASP